MKISISKKDRKRLDKLKIVVNFLTLSLISIVMVLFFIKGLVPIVLNMINNFLGIYNFWLVNNSDIYINFFGKVFMIIVSWKIFEALCNLWADTSRRVVRVWIKNIKKFKEVLK